MSLILSDRVRLLDLIRVLERRCCQCEYGWTCDVHELIRKVVEPK